MPRRRRSLPLALLALLIPLALAVGVFIGGHPGSVPRPLRGVFLGERERTLQDAYDIIQRDYYRRVSRDQLLDRGLAGSIRSLSDRFSNYFDPKAYKRFQQDTHGQFSGVGMEVSEVPRGLRITRVFPGAPAARAGWPHRLVRRGRQKQGSARTAAVGADVPAQAAGDLVRLHSGNLLGIGRIAQHVCDRRVLDPGAVLPVLAVDTRIVKAHAGEQRDRSIGVVVNKIAGWLHRLSRRRCGIAFETDA